MLHCQGAAIFMPVPYGRGSIVNKYSRDWLIIMYVSLNLARLLLDPML